MPRTFRMALLPKSFDRAIPRPIYAIAGMGVSSEELKAFRRIVSEKWLGWCKEMNLHPVHEAPFHLWRTDFVVHAGMKVRLDVGIHGGRFLLMGAQGREASEDSVNEHDGEFVAEDNEETGLSVDNVAFNNIFY
ncbi:hypothetical protein EYR36_009958 [Pleurotus pulmonarius]|nr:hypothetical protein EYR36_009958 [Pleurotus pulmonarius]KAF4593436.1 hypothetical protein EYR38_009150 [Pleurotus pulmonarius]